MNISTICPDCGKDMPDNISGHPFSDCRIKYIFPKSVVSELKTNKHMIKIEIEAATGAEARKEMLDFLGINANVTIGNGINTFTDLQPVTAEAKKVEMQIVDSPAITEETPKPETATRKRRSKAEIEAEAALAANTGSEEPPASTENVETPKVEETAEGADGVLYTSEHLIKMAVAIARTVGAEGRDANLAMLEKDFKGATISKKDGKPQLTTDQYPAVVEGFHRVITPFLPKLNDDQKKDLVKAGFNLGA